MHYSVSNRNVEDLLPSDLYSTGPGVWIRRYSKLRIIWLDPGPWISYICHILGEFRYAIRISECLVFPDLIWALNSIP